MCCNSFDDCSPKEPSVIQEAGFTNYEQFSLVFFFGIIAACGMLLFVLCVWRKYKGGAPQDTSERDHRYGVETIGSDSVYRFLLDESWYGWCIALAVLVAQLWMLFIFVQSSDNDLQNDNSDLVYTWKVRIHCWSSMHR